MRESILRSTSQRPLITTALAAIGSLWLASKVYSLTDFTNFHFLRRSSLDRYKVKTHGSSPTAWALVTGASDGIGRGFAEELCQRGFNVVLHGRNETKLEHVRDDLLTRWPDREIEVFVFDATGEISDLENAVNQLSDLNIKILINNVGAAPRPFWVPLAESHAEKMKMLVDVDAGFTTELTRILLARLIKRSPALIINIGSLASEGPCPYASVVSGVKAYNKAWSRSLNFEMKAEEHDVEVMHILVGMVATANEGRAVSFMVPSPRHMASSTLDKVGCGKDVVIGYWPHALQYPGITNLPSWVCERMILSIARAEKEKEERIMKNQ